MTTEIESLLERVRKAEGPDRDIDGAIEVHARRFRAYAVGLNDETRAKWQHNGPTVFDGDTRYDAERFTASVDAAVALIERVLPGCLWSVSRPVGYAKRKRKLPDNTRISIPYDAFVATDDRIGEPSHKFSVDEGATAALALLTSVLSVLALLHQASDKGMIDV